MHTSRPRWPAAALAALLLATGGLTAACSSEKASGPTLTSPQRPSTTTTQAESSGAADPTTPGVTVPGGSDLPNKIGDCGQVVLAYTQLAVTVLEGETAQQKVDETLAKVRPSIPPELQGDLKVVGDTYARAAKAGLLNASQVLSDPAFKKSNKAVGDWLTRQCGAPGTAGN